MFGNFNLFDEFWRIFSDLKNLLADFDNYCILKKVFYARLTFTVFKSTSETSSVNNVWLSPASSPGSMPPNTTPFSSLRKLLTSRCKSRLFSERQNFLI